jgi:tRNA pseudouridine55 synthase
MQLEHDMSQFTIRVRCSSGTYVRTLADDIGRALGTGGHLSALRRTVIGSFVLRDAVTLEDLEGMTCVGQESRDQLRVMLTLNDTVPHLPGVELEASRAGLAVNGREIHLTAVESSLLAESGTVKLCDTDRVLLAVGEYDRKRQTVKPVVVLAVSREGHELIKQGRPADG